MPKISSRIVAEFEGKEDVIQAIVSVLDRTFSAGSRPHALTRAADFFRGLDEETLRALAYRQGIFEGDLEPAPDEDRDRE
jgi:hypothetical protein